MQTKIGNTISYKRTFSTLALAGVLSAGFLLAPYVKADSFDQQIQSLKSQNTQTQVQVNQLQAQAKSYQDVITGLQSQIAATTAQINANQAKSNDLQNQITAAKIELDKQKKLLGDDIKQMYEEGQISTLEMLASSKNLSEFFDKQQYRTSVQKKIKDTLDKITALKIQLKNQKDEVDQLLKDEQAMQDQLNADQAKESGLLSYTEDQKNQFTKQIQVNNAQITQLRAQQAAAERAAFAGSTSTSGGIISYRALTGQQLCGGDYNFHCADIQDNYTDYWGLWNRECVSYTAWYEGTILNKSIPWHFFAGVGNANQWEGDLLRNPSVGSVVYPSENPSTSSLVGDVVYMPIGVLGHVGVVLGDLGNGWLRVGQYNIYDQGRYSEMDLQITHNLVFFHFN